MPKDLTKVSLTTGTFDFMVKRGIFIPAPTREAAKRKRASDQENPILVKAVLRAPKKRRVTLTQSTMAKRRIARIPKGR